MELENMHVNQFPAYVSWRERYAPPIVRMKGAFLAGADQATHYARQLAWLDTNIMFTAVDSPEPDLQSWNRFMENRSAVWRAWLHFIDQFERAMVREVLTRTFWQAYYS